MPRTLFLAIFGCLLAAGCLVHHEQQSQSAEDSPAVSADPFADSAEPPGVLGSEPQQLPPAESPPAKAAGYTGAIVFGNPRTCEACANLNADLWKLRLRGWTIGARGSPVYTGTEDFIFSMPEARHASTPTIEFYTDGKLIESVTGYSLVATFEERRDALAAVVDRHPSKAE